MTRCQVALGTRLMSPQPGLARPVQHAQPILCERAATEASRRQGVASHSTWSSGLPLKKRSVQHHKLQHHASAEALHPRRNPTPGATSLQPEHPRLEAARPPTKRL